LVSACLRMSAYLLVAASRRINASLRIGSTLRVDHVTRWLLGACGDHGRQAHYENQKSDDPHTRQSGPV